MISRNAASLALGLTAGALALPAQAISISGWSGLGNFGTLGADGVVTASPFPDSSAYGYVSTYNGVEGVALPGVGGAGMGTNGSVLTSMLFSANAGDALEFYFNYVTSDGSGYADYGWARLLDADMSQVALLFTARTTENGDTVPGYSMPTPEATLLPASTPIIGGGPQWSPLGSSSLSCYNVGCGYTGWVKASYTIASAGDYFLEFGVTNWLDTGYQSGMAFDGATIAGEVIGGPSNDVPEPTGLALLGLGLTALAVVRRRRG